MHSGWKCNFKFLSCTCAKQADLQGPGFRTCNRSHFCLNLDHPPASNMPPFWVVKRRVYSHWTILSCECNGAKSSKLNTLIRYCSLLAQALPTSKLLFNNSPLADVLPVCHREGTLNGTRKGSCSLEAAPYFTTRVHNTWPVHGK